MPTSGASTSAAGRLWVLWRDPGDRVGAGDVALSFLSPGDEHTLSARSEASIVSAREVFQLVDQNARELYVQLVARMGTAQLASGATYRRALGGGPQFGAWWLHPVSAKNCEHDPTFHHLLTIAAVEHEQDRLSPSETILFGAPAEVVAVLASRGEVRAEETVRPKSVVRTILEALIHRLAKTANEVLIVFKARNLKRSFPSWKSVLFGYWDWSVRPSKAKGALEDRYFCRLPNELERAGLGPVGWLVWVDRRIAAGRKVRGLLGLLEPLKFLPQVVALQSLLTVWDVVVAAGDFRSLARHLRYHRDVGFREALQSGGLDYFPLFKRELLKGFLDYNLVHGALVAKAVSRAAAGISPRLCLTFQEHFLHSRAIYQGLATGAPFALVGSTQHASYSPNKVYLYYDPELEFRGRPDGCAVPRPSVIFAMGELGRRLFASCGYKSERVVPTGSPRYDEAVRFVQLGSPAVRFAGKGVLEVLMTVSVDFWLEMDMVEAVCLAAEGLKNVRLRMRCHPDRRLDEDPKFRPYKDKVIVSGASLQEDLTAADIVIFTFTTVGEEAYLDGVNVWQWLPLGYNGSALSAVADILKFSRVEALREAFRLALEGRMPPTVGNKERCEVLRQLFHSSDGLAARRIAQKCADMLKKNSVSAPERTNE